MCAFVFAYGFSRFVGFENGLFYALSNAFATFIIYSVSNIKNLKEDKFLLILNVLALIFAAFFFFLSEISWLSIFILWLSFTISFFYVTPPFLLKFEVRSIPSLKILIIALVWVISCMLIPYLNSESEINYTLLLAIVFFYISIIIPFDIRDIRFDDPHLKTFPQLFGIKKSKRLALTLAFVSLLLIWFDNLSIHFKVLYSVDLIYITLLILFIHKIIRNKIYFILLDASVFILGLCFLI